MAKKARRAFIAKQDRPEVKINLDQAVSALKVRDLTQIVSQTFLKHFKDHVKEHIKIEKVEHKEGKEFKEHKPEKLEKHEGKEYKYEKLEHEGPIKQVLEPGPDPKGAREPGPDFGRIDPVTIDTLVSQVAKLSQVVAELQQRIR